MMRHRHLIGAAILPACLLVLATGSPSAQAADEPPRVSGFSTALDYLSTGSTLGLPLLYGLGTSALNAALTSAEFPAAGAPVRDQALVAQGVPAQAFTTMAPYDQQGIAALRSAIAPLAPFNPQFNAGLQAMADGSRAGAKALHPAVQPADLSIEQFATLLDGLQQK